MENGELKQSQKEYKQQLKQQKKQAQQQVLEQQQAQQPKKRGRKPNNPNLNQNDNNDGNNGIPAGLSKLFEQPPSMRNLGDEAVQQLLKKKDRRGRPRKFPVEETGVTIKGIRINGNRISKK